MPLGKQNLKQIKEKLEKRGVPESYKKLIIEYLEKLSRFVNIINVLLFGSVARGRAIPKKSDVDLIIIASEFISKDKVFELRRKIRCKLPGGIDSLWMNQKDFMEAFLGVSGAILDALYEGIILYDEDNFLNNLRSRLFKAIEKGEIERFKNYWRFPKVKIGERTEIKL